MIEEPELHASGSSQKPNSLLDHSTSSAPSRDRCVAQVAAAREVVEHEVAPGDGVDRVRRDLLEAEPLGEQLAVGVEVDARQRARAERQPPGLRGGRRRTAGGRGRASRSRPAGDGRDRPAARAAGACSPASASRRARAPARAARPSARGMRCSARSAASRVYIARSVTTWSLRERAVCRRPPTGPASSVRRRSIAMWMSSSPSANGKRAVAQLGLDGVEARQQRVAVGRRR